MVNAPNQAKELRAGRLIVDSSRSGFLARFLFGHEDDVQKPASFFEDFVPTVLMYADSRAEGTLSYAMMRKPKSSASEPASYKPESLTASKVFRYEKPTVPSGQTYWGEPFFGFQVTYQLKTSMFGIDQVDRYLKKPPGANSALVRSLRESLQFKIFHYSRDTIFGGFKAIDTVVRWPVIAAAAVQLFFERAGWAMRNNDTPYLRVPIRALGFLASGVGVVAAGVTSVSKVLVEFVRAPLAVAGGITGLLFGLGTAVFSRGNKNFGSAGKCILQGITDGIRPFAPAVADALNFYTGGAGKKARAPIPWGTIIGVTIGVALVIALSVVSFGGVAGVAAVLPLILTKLGIGGIVGSTYLAPLAAVIGKAVAAMHLGGVAASLGAAVAGIGLIGACTKAGTLIGNGLNALVNDGKRAMAPLTEKWNSFWKVRTDALALAGADASAANAVINVPMVNLGRRNSNDGAGVGIAPHQPQPQPQQIQQPPLQQPMPPVAHVAPNAPVPQPMPQAGVVPRDRGPAIVAPRREPTLQQQFREGMVKVSDASKDLSSKVTVAKQAPAAETKSNPFQPAHSHHLPHSSSTGNLPYNNNNNNNNININGGGDAGPTTAQSRNLLRSSTAGDLGGSRLRSNTKLFEEQLVEKTRNNSSASSNASDSPPHSPTTRKK